MGILGTSVDQKSDNWDGSLAWQPCPAALPGSLARHPRPVALHKYYKFNNGQNCKLS
jgi:hypothetical protein